ncbi:NfeD family protein [Pseudogracilibacillus auburnensis]|uniref:NfeD-like partner-binding protein n=1 Tax=Pseudogracilibacillus auburnensis TaxID=1494959 RepID=A0A2V3W2L7_9BACI|nr:NfeD family protein [Pseudogracilibacillus auburnensis]MBO1003509.1 nodulation protein NfeD [Pseudogracilibacillus auburnensis]PXW86505.1 NfeD-like partner-binding protein [Pseudogracilibacillus auburnensis]
MAALLDTSWIGFVIVGLGTLFLIGEILVNMRGLFALLGISFIVLYFYINIVDPSTFVIMLIIYFVGLLLILIDGKIINDGTLGTLGLAGMTFSVVLAAPNFFAGLYAFIGVILGAALSFTFLKVFKRRNMWSKITLKDRLTKEAGYSSLNEEYIQLIGKEGVTLTDLRPVGTIEIDKKEYSAISNAQWIKKGTKIQITDVDGTRILVKELEK